MNKKHIGFILKSLRGKLNLTQEQFSKKIGITRANLSQMERGASAPTLKTLIHIVTQFELDANIFFYEDMNLDEDSNKRDKIKNANEIEHFKKQIFLLEGQLKDKERIIELMEKK